MIVKVDAITNRQAVVRVYGEIVGIYDNANEASEHARRMVQVSGFRRSLVSCRWESKDEVVESLKASLNKIKHYDRAFNSREFEQDALTIRNLLK